MVVSVAAEAVPNLPFGLSLSKPCPSSSTAKQEGQPFDKLSANGGGEKANGSG
jgi:hypothetical protein